MESVRKLAMAAGAFVLSVVISSGMAIPAFAAGAAKGTIGKGHSYIPKASPYISYQYVDLCITNWGASGMALTYQGKATLGTATAKGQYRG